MSGTKYRFVPDGASTAVGRIMCVSCPPSPDRRTSVPRRAAEVPAAAATATPTETDVAEKPTKTPAAKPKPPLEIVEPTELVEALANYCEDEGLGDDDVVLHMYPFGGLTRTLRLMAGLRDGTWPVLDTEDTPSECTPHK